MEYSNLHIDFAKRTLCNLEYIEKARAHGDEVFEATQLINSLLGMVVFLKEGRQINAQKLREFWPDFAFDLIEDHNEYRSKPIKFIRLFRNGIAHCNIEQIVHGGDITGLRVWNECRCGTVTWKVEIDLDNIRKLAMHLVQQVTKRNS